MWKLIKIIIPKVTAEWEDLAFCMMYEVEEVNSFKKGSNGDPEQCCRKLFENWLATSHAPVPKTYTTLLNHIKQVEKLTAASEKIEKELIKGE